MKDQLENHIIYLTPDELLKLSQELVDAVIKLNPNKVLTFKKYKRALCYIITRKEINKIVGVDISNSTLCSIITTEHNGNMNSNIYYSIKRFIEYVSNYTEQPVPQTILWGPDYGKQEGVFINSINGKFIKWDFIAKEIEEQVLKGCPRIIPVGSSLKTLKFYNKENHIVRIFNSSGVVVGDLWLGGNPEKKWEHDGYIRIGKAISDTEWEVYQVYQRFSDSSYRLVYSNV